LPREKQTQGKNWIPHNLNKHKISHSDALPPFPEKIR
jgi:hypothetical protein